MYKNIGRYLYIQVQTSHLFSLFTKECWTFYHFEQQLEGFHLFSKYLLNAYIISGTILGIYDQHLGTSNIDSRWENDEKKAERGFTGAIVFHMKNNGSQRQTTD